MFRTSLAQTAVATLLSVSTLSIAPAHADDVHVGGAEVRDITACSVELDTLTVVTEAGYITVSKPAFRNVNKKLEGWLYKVKAPERGRIARCEIGRTLGQKALKLWTKKGGRWALLAPAVRVEAFPNPPRPDAIGIWNGHVEVYAPIAEDWRITEVVAAWNAVLPQDVATVSTTTEPCISSDSAYIRNNCITVNEVAEVTDHPFWLGAAFYHADQGYMKACTIELDTDTLSLHRAHIAAHEMGHCLGFPHWDHAESIMNTGIRYTTAPAGPRDVDIAWVHDAYYPEGS